MPIPTGPRPFDALAAELAADHLDGAPTLGSSLGLTEYDTLLPDMSASAVAARQRREDAWLERLTALPDGGLDDRDLDDQERIDRDLAVMVLRGRQVMRDWAEWRRSGDVYAGVALSGVFGLLLNRLRPDPELAEAVEARLAATPELLASGEANLDPELAAPDLLRRSAGVARAGAAYAHSVAGELAEGAGREAVAAAGERAGKAYDRFAAHLSELADRATGPWAIGEERYDALLRHAEGLDYGARELRERGEAAYVEIEADMRARARALSGDDDWRSLVAGFAREQAPGSPEEMLAAYREATEQSRQFCIDHDLVPMPPGERCEVVPAAPFVRGMAAVAHYSQPPPFAATNVGHFFVPYPPDDADEEQVRQRLATNNLPLLWSITAHEAYPGHHWHLSHLAARPQRLLRTMFMSTFFVEGWGLYSEDLMREHGFYRTPEQELQQRAMRAFRAVRIVVDTSLHLGEMTVEEAVRMVADRSGLSEQTAHTEVLRYCAMPTQAVSYLTGALEIDRLRRRWLHEALGPLRDFHDVTAGSGLLPVSLVERAVFG